MGTQVGDPPQVAVDNGHDLEWDPPHDLSNAQRWTCKAPGCGCAAIRYGRNEYGCAVEGPCKQDNS